MKSIAVIGAGGHTRSSLNLLRTRFKDEQIAIYDESYRADADEKILGIELVGALIDISENQSVFLSIGDINKRYIAYSAYQSQVLEENLFHPSTYIEPVVDMGKANQLYAKVYINNAVKIGDNNLFNTSAVIEHEVEIGSHNHISVGAKICGRVKIGDRCFLGCGAIVSDGVTLGDDITIGAGAVVVSDVLEPGTYVGVPARKIK